MRVLKISASFIRCILRIKLEKQCLANLKIFHLRIRGENPTIDILLCRKKSNSVVEMTLPEDATQIIIHKLFGTLLAIL